MAQVINIAERKFARFVSDLIYNNMKRLHESGECDVIPVGCIICGTFDTDRSDLEARSDFFVIGDLTP